MREPTKAAYLRFESSPTLEFEFFLAEKLSMTVGELRERMTEHELVHWGIYYGRQAQRRELAEAKARGRR